MDTNKFNEIIDFAIKGEQDAVNFYQELQERSDFEGQKSLLKDFEQMEKGHINMLQNIKSKGKNDYLVIPKVENLSISDFLVEVEPGSNMSYQDILIIAMKREEKALKLYQKLAEESENEEIKNLFLKLVSEESSHKNHFEKNYDDKMYDEKRQ